MEQVLEVYSRDYNPDNPVVCFDECPKQLISEVVDSYMDDKGVVHQDYEYERKGVVDLFMIVEPLAGRREVLLRESHTGLIWAEIMAYILEQMYPQEDKVTIVMDNLSTHKEYNLYKVFPPERARAIIERMEIINTPKHGSWLNIAECELSVLARQAINKRFDDKQELENQIQAWTKKRNELQKGVDWQFTTKNARKKLKRLYPTVLI